MTRSGTMCSSPDSVQHQTSCGLVKNREHTYSYGERTAFQKTNREWNRNKEAYRMNAYNQTRAHTQQKQCNVYKA